MLAIDKSFLATRNSEPFAYLLQWSVIPQP